MTVQLADTDGRWAISPLSALAPASSSTARRAIGCETLAVFDGGEARHFAGLLGRELRVGLKEAQVEEALAREVVASLRGLGVGLVLDREHIAVMPDDRLQARAFAVLQRRLGRKASTQSVVEELPRFHRLPFAIDRELVLDAS